MKRLLSFLFSILLLSIPITSSALAAEWPDPISVSAEGAILMDTDSGAVLYGKNIHTAYYPASITKILTALIVIETCDLDDIVTFSHDAVYNVEPGSSSAGLDEGDRLTVRDTLYAMLLKSANEAANALAEHAAGSNEAFAELMNQKAASLGCTDSHFNNPSGLNDPEHYTSAYDMALIAQAAFRNETFVTIVSTLYYDLPPTRHNPDGLRIYPGHKMLKKNLSQYYPGIIGGKTGYTSLAGNTLVTCAARDGMRLVSVVLNGQKTHYEDTRALMDFGFQNFTALDAAAFDDTYSSIPNDMSIAGLPTTNLSILKLQENCQITLPIQADPAEVESAISYTLPGSAPREAIARISYTYDGHQVGAAYLTVQETDTSQILSAENRQAAAALAASMPPEETESESEDSPQTPQAKAAEQEPENSASPASERDAAPGLDDASDHEKSSRSKLSWKVFLIPGAVLGVLALSASLLLIRKRQKQQEAAEQELRSQRRRQRLKEIGMSPAEFELLVQQARQKQKPRHSKRPKKHKSFLDSKR